jgi:hypothetical protein
MRRRERIRRLTILVVVVVIVVSLAVGIYLAFNSSSPNAQYVGKQVSASILNDLTGVADSTLSTIGVPKGVNLPASISGSLLTSNGKPEVLYVGGEYCPYCAIERWSLIIALARFGQFSNLTYMLSSSTDVNSNTPTFSFETVTYSSSYITFVPVEEFGQDASTIIQPLTDTQQSLVTQYDTCAASGGSGGIPFVDIGNAYAVNCGAQNTLDLSGENWTQIAPQLNNPSSNVAILIDGTANTLITAICKIDGGAPSSVCSQPYASQTISYARPVSSGSVAFLMVAPAHRPGPAWSR